jgi:hypothetical protein
VNFGDFQARVGPNFPNQTCQRLFDQESAALGFLSQIVCDEGSNSQYEKG